jgi:ABC-2 type transport system ATP-binding protein
VINVVHGALLRGCSLDVPVGARVLLVSEPEGAASALVRVLAGLSPPSSGRMEIAGSGNGTGPGWGHRVAHLGPEPGIPRWMTPREAIGLSARLAELPPEEARVRTDRALAWVGIRGDAADRAVRHGGPPLVQRTGLAAALIGDPEVLLLDEPLRALDTLERTRLLRLPGPRHTILIASRYPASEAGLVSHVAMLRNGRTALFAPITALEEAGQPLSMRGISRLAAASAPTPS